MIDCFLGLIGFFLGSVTIVSSIIFIISLWAEIKKDISKIDMMKCLKKMMKGQS